MDHLKHPPGAENMSMMGLPPICWSIKARNKACFEKVYIRHPGEIIYVVCTFIRYCAGLYSEESQKMINSGVELMMKTRARKWNSATEERRRKQG